VELSVIRLLSYIYTTGPSRHNRFKSSAGNVNSANVLPGWRSSFTPEAEAKR